MSSSSATPAPTPTPMPTISSIGSVISLSNQLVSPYMALQNYTNNLVNWISNMQSSITRIQNSTNFQTVASQTEVTYLTALAAALTQFIAQLPVDPNAPVVTVQASPK